MLAADVPKLKPKPKSVKKKNVTFRLNEAEEKIVRGKVKEEGLSIADWFRSKLKNPPAELPPPSKRGLRSVRFNACVPNEEHQQYITVVKAVGLSLACWTRTAALEALLTD